MRPNSAGWTVAWATLPFVILALVLAWMPYLPNRLGRIGEDYSVWLPSLLAGYFWHVQSGFGAVAWFNPAQCGGVPMQADPQGAFFSLPQLLTFLVPPLRAIQLSFVSFASVGFLGGFLLARQRFRLSLPAALLSSTVFAFNSFYAVRMIVGHLSFAPFMLLPLMSACMLGAEPQGAGKPADYAVRCGCFALVFGIMVQSGMLVLLPPAFLALLIVLGLYALHTGDRITLPLWRMGIGTLLGLALCAGKLAAVFSLMAHIPRDAYPLPGFGNIAETAWVAVRAVFLRPSADMPQHLVNTIVPFGPHEFDYGVGPVPLVLIIASVATLRRFAWFGRRHRTVFCLLLGLLLVPIAVNTYGPAWTGMLKSLPVIRSSSSLLRWFAAYILPVSLAGGMALDRLVAVRLLRPWPFTAAASCAGLALLALTDRSAYGPGGMGGYDPGVIEAAWKRVSVSRIVPVVTNIAVVQDAKGQVDKTALTRQDGMAQGQSQLFCYDPLFGYQLETFPQGALHVGSVFDRTGSDGTQGAQLNLKNPACYVFPQANGCTPGDAFAASAIDNARDFAAYKPFAWNKPIWARVADWVSLVTWPLAILVILAASLSRKLLPRSPRLTT